MKHSKLLLPLCLMLGIATYFASCEKKYDNETVYKGKVVNTVTSKPFPDLEVKVTDGEHINATVKTDENGQFSILVKFNEINGNYYLLIGDASCVQVRRDFKGFGQAEINLGDIEVEGPKSATITTLLVTNVTAESALTGGNITDDGRAEITARGVCWSKQEYPTINDNHTTNGTGKGEYQSEIKGLDGGCTYYVRAYAISSVGTSYGEQFKFSTETGFPVVATGTISNVTATSANCGGSITDDAGYQITACGVCWSTTTSYPTIENSHTSDVAANGSFKSVMENLERNTSYYVRAYATNKNGTSYGETMSFITITGIPVVKTESITNVMALSAMGKGNIIDNSGYAITSCGFCWSSTNTMPTVSGGHTTEIALTGEFDSYIDNLDRNTTYYARAYATNNMGIGYGEVVTFTTTNGVPVVKTDPVTDILALSVTGNGEILDDSGYSITECGFCWSKTNSKPSINDSYSTEFTTSGKFSGTVSNLEKNTSYYLRAYAKNKIGISYGETVTFITILGLPVVTTGDVTNIRASSATCAGDIITNSGYGIVACGLCWSDNNPYPTVSDSHSTEAVTSGSFSSKMMNLEHNTTYYVRAYATNDKGTGYGETKTFTTVNGLPVVSTGSVRDVTATSAVCSDNNVQTAEFAITARGICWSSSTATPTIENDHTSEVATTGSFSSTMSNLEDNTKYYVRAYATNSKGTSYGATVQFTTVSGMLIVTTSDIHDILATSAKCGGAVADNVSFPIKSCGVCWSSSTSTPTLDNDHTTDVCASGSFSSTMINLLPNKTYYIRAYAINAKGTSYGEVKSFSTISSLPSVTTGTVSTIYATSAVCSGNKVQSPEFPIIARGICWSSSTATPTIENDHTSEVAITGTFSSTMSNLKDNTKYYVRAYATNSEGISYGETVTFTTISGMPVVTTGSVSSVTSISAKCGGTVANNISYPIKSCGVCWSSSSSTPTIQDAHTTDITSSGTFTSTLTNLSPNKTYYVRAYATNDQGTSYGTVVSFNTQDGLPSVTTAEVGENITSTTITAGGRVVSDGGFAVTARGVVWGNLPYPTIERDSYTTDGTGIGYYSSKITNADTSTNVYIRSYATNKNGTSYGEQLTITPENFQYMSLKTFVLGGYTYKIYLGLGNLSNSNGYCQTACDNLTFGGYSDWFLPNEQEGRAILEAYNAWGQQNSSVQGITQFWYTEGGHRYSYYYCGTSDAWCKNTSINLYICNAIALRKISSGESGSSGSTSYPSHISVQSVTMSKTSHAFTSVGQTVQLTAIVSPSNATYPTITWQSSNTAVATVSGNGLVSCTGSGSATITAIADGKSATCTISAEISLASGTVVDVCGNKYKYVRIGTQYWMAENMRCNKYDTHSEQAGRTISNSYSFLTLAPCYTDASKYWSSKQYSGNLTSSQISKLGYLYSWAAAVGLLTGSEADNQKTNFNSKRQGICPNGWHVPTNTEWYTLQNYIGSREGVKMKSSSGWYNSANGTDDYSFTALPAGNTASSSADYVGKETGFWTATPRGDGAQSRQLDSDNDFLGDYNSHKGMGYSVRCVKD